MTEIKMVQSDWLTVFWPISQELGFSPITRFVQKYSKQNKISLWNKFRKNQWPSYLIFLAHFWGKKNVPKNCPSVKTRYGFVTPCQNLEKTNDTIPTKHTDRRTGRQKDRLTLFHRTLPATAGGLKKTVYLENIAKTLCFSDPNFR